ncbi:MAG TPA: NAD(P)H-dependent oxidoreductase subunit E, partial [Burkholderiaceae bacterium]|nr:NAD(P)H-dependent oxidoreductase subunit E [Burkholderiaceae bacterium]
MNHPTIPIVLAAPDRRRKRQAPKGRRVDPTALAEVRALLNGETLRRDLLIEYLHRINDRYGQLGTPHLAALAQELKLAQTEVYEVASFYHHFEIVKEGPNGRVAAAPALTVRVCDGLSCELAGAQDLLARLPALLGTDVRVIPAPCVGRCEQAPVAVVHHNAVPLATTRAVQACVQRQVTAPALEPTLDLAAYVAQGGYALLSECLDGQRDAEAVIKALEDTGLRGLGGAGFPAGRKWRIVRNEPAPRLMAVNIDEGEPGTFKDRYYLERDPHRFIEGMLIAAWVVEAPATYFYLRDEYPEVRLLLEQEIAKVQAAGLAPHTTLHMRRGAGAYICGE